MFKNYLIIASKEDKAGINITTSLSQFGKFNFHLVEGEILSEHNLSQERISQFDFIIFASRHKSEVPMKTLSIHAPGNFKEIWGGGKPGKLCPASAQFNKFLFENIKKFQKEYDLNNYNLTLEVTHHGPLIEKPCVFIEVGGSENEWKDKRAAFILAKAISETIENFKENEYLEIAIGIGGPHYAPGFNSLQEESNVAFAHIIPKYMQPITQEMILEARDKTFEEVDFAVVDWKGLGNAEERDKVIKILEDNYIPWKKIQEIKR
jgi:D-aminoacyl-tRNA deacylase